MGQNRDKAAVQETGKTVRQALLVELENVMLGGREIAYGVLKRRLAEKSINLTPALFSRFATERSPKEYLPQLFRALKLGECEDGLAGQVEADLRAAIVAEGGKISAHVRKLLETVSGKGVVVGVVSMLGVETARQLVAQLGLDEVVGGRVFSCGSDKRHVPSVDAWLKAAKVLGVAPRCCVTVASSSASCRAASAGGMRCVVVTDRFTAHQDCGGADVVVDVIDASLLERMLALLEERK